MLPPTLANTTPKQYTPSSLLSKTPHIRSTPIKSDYSNEIQLINGESITQQQQNQAVQIDSIDTNSTNNQPIITDASPNTTLSKQSGTQPRFDSLQHASGEAQYGTSDSSHVLPSVSSFHNVAETQSFVKTETPTETATHGTQSSFSVCMADIVTIYNQQLV